VFTKTKAPSIYKKLFQILSRCALSYFYMLLSFRKSVLHPSDSIIYTWKFYRKKGRIVSAIRIMKVNEVEKANSRHGDKVIFSEVSKQDFQLVIDACTRA
jgi:hypothetical protein